MPMKYLDLSVENVELKRKIAVLEKQVEEQDTKRAKALVDQAHNMNVNVARQDVAKMKMISHLEEKVAELQKQNLAQTWTITQDNARASCGEQR